MPDELDRIMFQCTVSEANDLAIRVAQTYTGGGVIVTSDGNSALTSKLSALGTANAWLDPMCDDSHAGQHLPLGH